MAAARRHRVAAVALDGVAPFELAVACEVFGIDRSELGVPWYRFKVCAATPPPVRSSVGFTIDTPHGLDDIARADTIVVPAASGIDEQDLSALHDVLRRAHRRGARIVSVCSGAFVLADAGLLDGRRATTHWMHTDALAERHPAVKVERDVLYVEDEGIFTSAGTAAGIDLCLHLVRRDHGAEIANAVARRMVVPPHRDGGQAQFVDAPVPCCPDDDPLASLLDWVIAHLDEPHDVTSLAAAASMSPRTFARRFRAATGTTPHQWLLRQRVLAAQRLLEGTDDPIERIATATGFGSAAALRQHFSRQVQTSPQAYRRAFRG